MSIFKAVQCSQCGSPLDVAHMRCNACGTNATINWGKAVTSITGRKQHFSDPVVEAVILAGVQMVATAQSIEIDLTVSGGNGSSAVSVMVKDTYTGAWQEAGKLTCFTTTGGRPSYRLVAGKEYGGVNVSLSLDWTDRLEGEGRFYQIEEDGMYSRPETVRGEDELYKRLLIEFASEIADVATHSARHMAAKAKEEAARAAKPKNLFARFFGL